MLSHKGFPIVEHVKKFVDICYTLFMVKMTAGTGMSHIFLLKNH